MRAIYESTLAILAGVAAATVAGASVVLGAKGVIWLASQFSGNLP